jgi:hypothetical protein
MVRLGDIARGDAQVIARRAAKSIAERQRRAYVRLAGRRADGRIIRPIPDGAL